MNKTDDLLALLGKSLTSPEVKALQTGSDRPEVEEFDPTIHHCYYRRGFALLFHDGILQTIQLFPEGREGYKGYSDPLPHGLRFSFKQKDVRSHLGNPLEEGGDEAEVFDVYRFPSHVLNVTYAKGPGTIQLLSFMTPEEYAKYTD